MKGLTNFYLVISFLCLVGCGNEPKGNATGDSATTEVAQNKVADPHAGHDHSGHSHDGHDHSGHDHSSHSHETKPTKPSPKPNTITQKRTVSKADQLAEIESLKGSVPQDQLDAKKKAIKNSPDIVKTTKPANPAEPYASLPDACTLITESQIAKIIGVDAAGVSLKDGSGPAATHSRACFFRWDHKGIANSGVMVQIQDNPLPDEFPDWAAYYINGKLTEGDKKPDASEAFKYKKLEGIGVAGAYSFQMHRYMWRTEDDFVIGVAFNLPASEAEEVAWAKRIGAEVMKNFNK